VKKNVAINLKSCDKEQLGLFAAKIRAWRPPEPYKGKGIIYEGEIVKRKAGKSGKK
jgi:large subunit ribosomal protein L6